MNGTIGRGTAVHKLTGDYANCGKGMGRNAITRTSAPVDCKACLKVTPEVTYEITYRKNTLARGWVTKVQNWTGTEEKALQLIAKMSSMTGFQVLGSRKI
jgi:hypothetical protein